MAYKDREQQLAYNKQYNKVYYQTNKTEQRQRLTKRRLELREWLITLKANLKCELCPENHIAALDFHHCNGEKELSVANAVSQGWSKKRIMKEIEKCKVLCSNCHRKLHSKY